MIPAAFRNAHEEVDISLSDIAALVNGISVILYSTSCLKEGSLDAQTINVLVRTIEAECEKAVTHQAAAWAVICEAFGVNREVQP